MDAKTKMRMVNDIAGDICENLGKLTRYGVLSYEESVEIIKKVNDKHYKWMQNNFTCNEVYEFASQLIK